jgi:hypothetical protein
MLDSDLARLCGVAAKNLNKAVRRNFSRFPADFICTYVAVIRHSSLPNRVRPCFQCSAQFPRGSSNLAIMRALVQIREMISTHKPLHRKIAAMEKRYDARFQSIFATIPEILQIPIPPKGHIGFPTDATIVFAKSGRRANL